MGEVGPLMVGGSLCHLPILRNFAHLCCLFIRGGWLRLGDEK